MRKPGKQEQPEDAMHRLKLYRNLRYLRSLLPFKVQTCAMRRRFVPIQTHFEQKVTKVTKGEIPGWWTRHQARKIRMSARMD
jgi:hypothetical protein